MPITTEDAIRLANSEFWNELTLQERAKFQLFEPRLCMPFSVFHEAVEETLGRPVFTHEFAFMDRLQKELLGEAPAPSFEDILALIPADKRVLIITK